MRRVGNRDFYTRVKLAEGQEESELEAAVKSSDAGVKKPAYLLDSSDTALETSKKYVDKESPKSEEQQQEENNPQAENLIDLDEGLEFNQLLDRLAEMRVSVEQNERIETLHNLNELSVEYEIKLLNTFRKMLRKFSADLSLEEWDFLVSSLNKWVGWISKSDHPLREAHHAELCTKVFGFIHQIFMFADKVQREAGDLSESPLMQALLDDWGNFRSSSIFLDLIALYLKLISPEQNDEQINPTVGPMIEALAHIIVTVDPKMVLSHHSLLDHLSTKIEFDAEFKEPKNSVFCSANEKSFLAVCGLMRSNFRVIIVTAHAILNKILDSICRRAQSSTLISDHEAVDDALIFPPAAFMAILTSRDSMMSALLSDYRVGDISVTIEPDTDSYGCTLAYLFAWDLVIQFIVGMDKEVGQCMIHSLKKLGLIQRLLDNIFILLPPLDDRDSLNFRFESSNHHYCENSPGERARDWSLMDFLKSPLQTTIERPVNEIELVALHLYFSVALHMPVTVRKWYNNNSNKRLCNLVNEYTVKHISQLICSLEMESVLEKCHERASKDVSNNLTIKARPSAKEVYAIYTRDEFKMELTIKLPLNYPLGPVQIDGGKRVGVTDVKWRSWLLQLTTFLAHQNGPILDGVDLWRKNIDKRFEGVEKCTICFSILHSNYQLPKKKCQTCANMFHNLCLYKWFESSGNSTCPLCRNPW